MLVGGIVIAIFVCDATLVIGQIAFATAVLYRLRNGGPGDAAGLSERGSLAPGGEAPGQPRERAFGGPQARTLPSGAVLSKRPLKLKPQGSEEPARVDFRVGSGRVHLKLLRKNAAYRSGHFPGVVAIGKQRIVPMVHSYRRRPVAVASIQTLAGRSRVANATSRHQHSARVVVRPLNVVEVPDTFVDATRGSSDGDPVGDADPRARRPGPTPSMRFERMVQPEPATTSLVAENSCLPVDPDYRWFAAK